MKHCVFVGITLVLLLSACGGGTETAPQLVAPPTRTAPSFTETPPIQFEIVSLRDAVTAFLTQAADASPIDWPVLFDQTVAASNCLAGSLFPDVDPLELMDFNLISMDLGRWSDAVQNFPEDALIAAAADTLNRAVDVLPPDGVFRLCLLPVPDFEWRGETHSIFSARVLGGNHLLVACSPGDTCLERLPAETAYGYGYAYQVQQTGLAGVETSVLRFAIYAGRATDFARQIDPAAVFDWDNALTPDQEVAVWDVMQEYLTTTYRDYPGGRNVDKILYGGGATTADRYPPWGGVYLGTRIVQAYRASHPGVTLADLETLDPQALLAESGYSPGGHADVTQGE